MVHCIQNNNNHQNKKNENHLEIEVNEDLQQEMMLLSTKDDENLSSAPIINCSSKTTSQEKNLKNEAFSVLSYDQVKRLHHVIQQVVPIHGKIGNFPTLDIKLKDLVKIVRTKLETEQNVKVRLNFCLFSSSSF